MRPRTPPYRFTPLTPDKIESMQVKHALLFFPLVGVWFDVSKRYFWWLFFLVINRMCVDCLTPVKW